MVTLSYLKSLKGKIVPMEVLSQDEKLYLKPCTDPNYMVGFFLFKRKSSSDSHYLLSYRLRSI